MFKYFSLVHYRLLTRLISPVIWLWDAHRAWKQPIYRPFRHERWSVNLPPTAAKARIQQFIWIHAVSVGETQAAAPLLREILACYPMHSVLLTHMTPTGRDTGAALFAKEIAAGRVQQCYLPYDIAGLPERFLEHFQPVLGMFLETEIWPNWIQACMRAAIPLGLANGRLSEKSLAKAKRLPALASASYDGFAWVAAQSADDARRYQQLRSKSIAVTGNLKFDVQANAEQLVSGRAFKTQQGRLILALASTRDGEEALLLPIAKTWQSKLAAQGQSPLILLIPRHPKRADELLRLLGQLALSFVQRSLEQTPSAHTQVYLCDH